MTSRCKKHRVRELVALLFCAGALSANTPPSPVAPTLGALQALEEQRLAQPIAFVEAVQQLSDAPPPADPLTRDTLQLLQAQALALEGRFDESRHLALPLSTTAASPSLRLRASGMLVQMLAATRDFVDGQQQLETLQRQAADVDDPAMRRYVDTVAAIFYTQLSQDELAIEFAERVLASAPTPVERCIANLQVIEARPPSPKAPRSDARFAEAVALCNVAGGDLLRGQVDVAEARWLSNAGREDEAIALLAERLPAITATGYPRLRAEAHALLAEALRRRGDLAGAEAEASAALALSASLPTGLPLLMARRTRYELALARGDSTRALGELQAVVAAERAYAEEVRQLQSAYQSGRGEAIARQQALAVLQERNTSLGESTSAAGRMVQGLRWLFAPLGLMLLGLALWALRARRQRHRYRALTQVDSLTGLWARAHFTQKASAALAKAERLAQPMALLLIDLDHFSAINSRFGHLSGDRLLTAVGEAFLQLESPGLHFGRMGGEEFAILLPRSGLDEGLAFAERCRARIAEVRATALDGESAMSVTSSFGVVSTVAAGYRLRDLLANADQALYRAKHAGRNRVAAAVVVPVNTDAAA